MEGQGSHRAPQAIPGASMESTVQQHWDLVANRGDGS